MKAYVSNGKVFIWDDKDAHTLRMEHRIIGSLVGCLPNKAFQNLRKWLPLQLMPEEVTLLKDEGVIQLFLSPTTSPEDTIIQSYFERRDKLCEEQIALMKENRQKIILEKANEIYEGKKRKYIDMITGKRTKKSKGEASSAVDEVVKDSEQQVLPPDDKADSDINVEALSPEKPYPNETEEVEVSLLEETVEMNEVEVGNSETDAFEKKEPLKPDEDENQDIDCSSINKQEIIDKELAKVTEMSKDLCMIQLFTECSWKDKVEIQEADWNFPSNNAEKLRYAVFKDMWKKGYYLTAGSKFGGDFLAYEGDPLKYHALYIIICMPYNKNFQAIDLVVYGRLGNQVKKTVVLASLNAEGVEYISLNWLPQID